MDETGNTNTIPLEVILRAADALERMAAIGVNPTPFFLAEMRADCAFAARDLRSEINAYLEQVAA